MTWLASKGWLLPHSSHGKADHAPGCIFRNAISLNDVLLTVMNVPGSDVAGYAYMRQLLQMHYDCCNSA
jgi:hypothetical protein